MDSDPGTTQVRGQVDRALSNRFECKYFLPPGRQAALREYIRPFVRLDQHAPRGGAGRYCVCSLYLDTAELRMFREAVRGLKTRMKLRIRTYADGPADPVFFEIKRRVNGIIHKQRELVDRGTALSLVRRFVGSANGETDGRTARNFAFLAESIGAVPALRVKYMREAYESRGPDPVRITFDTQLETAPARDGELSSKHGPWQHIPLPGVILEVKFTENYPSWVGHMVRAFELDKTSCSKYVKSVTAATPLGGAQPSLWTLRRR